MIPITINSDPSLKGVMLMAKKLYLHIKWDETREKNNLRAGADGVYDVEIDEDSEVNLIKLNKAATVTRLTDEEVTIDVPARGEYVIKLNESATVVYTDSYQVAGDGVDERLTYEIKLSDMSLEEYEASLPEYDIQDGVLIKARPKGEVAVVPEGIVKIGRGAFSRTGIKEVVLPSTLKEIGSDAFEHCWRLSKITLPDGLERIGFFAFAFTFISEINIPESVCSIDDSVFFGTPLYKKKENEESHASKGESE